MTKWSRCASLGVVMLAPLLAGGCLERTIEITSEPPGALVYLNDVELGRTPVSTAFTFHGSYDVRLRLDGYEPIDTSRVAEAPVQEWPGIDLIAEAMPVTFSNTIEWHFELEPALEFGEDPGSFRTGLLSRARELRYRTSPVVAKPVEGRPLGEAQSDGADADGRAGAPTTVDPGSTSETTTPPAPTTLP